VINALQELDFDYKLGKVPEDGYPAQRAELLQRGATILKALDELVPPVSSRANPSDRIEQAVAEAPAVDAETSDELGDERIESLLAARRAARSNKSAGFCPNCGKPILLNDRFCPNCGKSLQ
jgi:hypothetical protein